MKETNISKCCLVNIFHYKSPYVIKYIDCKSMNNNLLYYVYTIVT